MMVRELPLQEVSVVKKFQFSVPKVVMTMLDINPPEDIWTAVDPETKRVFISKEKPVIDGYPVLKTRVSRSYQAVLRSKLHKYLPVQPGDRILMKLDVQTLRIYLEKAE